MNVRQRISTAHALSERAATWALLNCLTREIALPTHVLDYHSPSITDGLPQRHTGVPLVLIRWPGGRAVFVVVDRIDPLGAHRYLTRPYLFDPSRQRWWCPTYSELIAYALEELARDTGASPHELHAQMLQSVSVMRELIEARQTSGECALTLTDYVDSEQALWAGHPAHPAPKARQWPAGSEADAYVPERKNRARLYQWAVPRQGLRVLSHSLSVSDVLESVGDQRRARPGEAVISMHPIQARLFAATPSVAALIDQGVIRDLGESGFLAAPTASLRTWHIEDKPFFIKGSLNVRVTNCVRKNAWYELESAQVIDALMTDIVARRDPLLSTLTLAREPAALSWAPPGADPETARWFTEQTGTVLRENFCTREGRTRCVLAAALFSRTPEDLALIEAFIGGEDAHARALDWFDAYAMALLMPVLTLFFRDGVVLEPHLQNCVLIHDNGWPHRVLLRDFEGIKLTEDLGVDALPANVSSTVRASLTYSRAQGWNRIVYCVMINHLSEAILALSWERPALGERLWAQLRDVLERVRETLPGPAPELDALLDGESLPCKTNLLVRLRAAPDRDAGYVALPTPWVREVVHG
ncbi:IucA/IucC family protein [Larsenimonas salina]|uniref:IucA/IucC family protein n=1 Tax=Larsenimonas salina TaxID=1295565 RepID=UPI002074854E|nr:IucA/IucC family protein [Larsenimonas salina]MCM5704498.1 IucA/IucC family siderophore biosynthesis protein [Larsenimonas salina]